MKFLKKNIQKKELNAEMVLQKKRYIYIPVLFQYWH